MAFSAKAFLEGTRQTGVELKREQERLKEMEAGLYEVKGASIGLGVHTNSHTDISDRLIKVEAQREKVIQLHKRWLNESGKAETMIRAIHAPLVQCAMECRFLLGDTWEKVALEIGADISYCYKLAKRGYREIEERQQENGTSDGEV